ncbi:hypothetical protein BGY98DRAFT_1187799, partial [Russula aff. rugulosa BPL654]
MELLVGAHDVFISKTCSLFHHKEDASLFRYKSNYNQGPQPVSQIIKRESWEGMRITVEERGSESVLPCHRQRVVQRKKRPASGYYPHAGPCTPQYLTQSLSNCQKIRPNLCWKNGRVRAGKRVYLAGMGVGKRARVPGSRYKYFIWTRVPWRW